MHKHTDPKIGNHHIQLGYFKWMWLKLMGKTQLPKPALFYPAHGWISDPDEIIRAIRLDDAMGIDGSVEQPSEPRASRKLAKGITEDRK